MPGKIEQQASSQAPKLGKGDIGTTKVRAAFARPTTRGRTVVAALLLTGGLDLSVYFSDSRFKLKRIYNGIRDLKLAVWYLENAPPITELTAWTSAYRGLHLQLFEISGLAQINAMDQFVVSAGESQFPSVGPTGTLATQGEFVLGIVASQYISATQGGFSGGLTQLTQAEVPGQSQQDWERGRATYHIATEAGTAARRLSARLSTSRRWICFLMTFRPGTAPGQPARLTATKDRNVLTVGGRGRLTAFGPLRATKNRAALGNVRSVRARIGPGEGQIRLNGWTGLLIGKGTPYRIQSIEGLGGQSVRSSDDPLARGDGDSRGVDLQSARQFSIKVNWNGTPAQIEQRRQALYRAVPVRREVDQEMVFREPGGPLQSIWCRATEVPRDDDIDTRFRAEQSIVFRAADPRHYSAIRKRVTVPVTPDETETVTIVGAVNEGSARAYPLIRVITPATGVPVTRIQLVNVSAAVTFDVMATFPLGGELVGDMNARVTSAPVSYVTIDDEGRYGAWQLPRDNFYLAPASEVDGGTNLLYLRTTPVGVPVICTLDFYDTSSG